MLSWLDVRSRAHPDEVYLRRLRVVNTPWFSVYLHWIYDEDRDRFPHDHPWNFCSFIVRGGYVEELYDSPGADAVRLRWRRWSWHRMPLGKAHRIVDITGPLLTLVVTGRREQVWGFWTPRGKLPYSDYVKAYPDEASGA